ncbi:MAG: bifunctional oligoribonuclease/PAP phosphatase NrnA [Chthoniobacterales bacterium]|nr:bifunctional oligoribonuclease/PAP phosphatase NrnA [Chthoniobacterales bacterium]
MSTEGSASFQLADNPGSKREATFPEIAAALRKAQTIVVLSHVRPDGDAYGSQLAMALSLRELGKDVTVWNEDGMLEKYSFMPGSDLLQRPPAESQTFDLGVALDTAIQTRLGTAGEAAHAPKWVNIDHHPTNPRYGDYVYIDPTAPATGEILFELLSAERLPINRDIAENLFVAISTDTGSFQYPNTTARTFEIGAKLLQCGVEVGRVSQLLYETYPRRRVELLRELLGTMRFEAEGQVASFSLRLAVAKSLGVVPEDNEGLIDHLRAIQGVVVAVFFEELLEGKVRVSMRSKSDAADVAAICQQFGGGGHKLAAGARVRGTLREVEERVLGAINEVVAAAGAGVK